MTSTATNVWVFLSEPLYINILSLELISCSLVDPTFQNSVQLNKTELTKLQLITKQKSNIQCAHAIQFDQGIFYSRFSRQPEAYRSLAGDPPNSSRRDPEELQSPNQILSCNLYFSTGYETYNRGVMGVETNIAANKRLENEQYNLFIY